MIAEAHNPDVVRDLPAPAPSGALLVVEPDETKSEHIRALIDELFQHRTPDGALTLQSTVHYVSTARQAINYCRMQPVGCVLLSDSLPDLESLGLISLLRSKETVQQLPVVVLIGERDDQETLSAMRCGASEVLAWDRITAKTLLEKITSARNRVQVLNAMANQRLENEILALELSRRQRMMKQALDEFVHALRTPLGSINEFISLVLDGVGGDISERQGKFLALARGACWTLDREIASVYSVADITADLTRTDMQKVRIQDAIELAIAELELEAEFSGVSISAVYEEELAPVRADAMQMCQVLIRLTSRAMSIVGPGGQLILAANLMPRDETRLDVSIQLNRCDAQGENLHSLLSPNVDSVDSLGNQLRISNCAEIIEAHGSVLEIVNEGFERSRVHFTLPLYTDN